MNAHGKAPAEVRGSGTVPRTPPRNCYIDMDGLFASAEQHLRPELRGLPIGVHAGTPEHRNGTFISVLPEAKAEGIRSGMRSREARRALPSLSVLAQRPVEYIRLHHALLACIGQMAPVHEVHSVDEVLIALSPSDDPLDLMTALREAVSSAFSPALTFAAGVASSVWLSKVAAECGKGPSGERGGSIDWTPPGVLPEVLFDLDLEDLPRVGDRKAARLRKHGIESVRDFYEASLTRIRDAYGSVDGERMWLAMHGHDVRWTTRKTPKSLSHSRVLERSAAARTRAEPVARWLALCGWLRARREGLRAGRVRVEGKEGERVYQVISAVRHPGGEAEALGATSAAWRRLRERCLPEKVSVVLDALSPDPWSNFDLFDGVDSLDTPLDAAVARIRERYGVHAIRYGDTADSTGPYTGLKIAFERVPSLAEVEMFAKMSSGYPRQVVVQGSSVRRK